MSEDKAEYRAQDEMPEDLIWLAKNVTQWEGDDFHRYLSRSEINGWLWYGPPKSEDEYSRAQWEVARRLLGIDTPTWPEEQMDVVASNGNDGEHYDDPTAASAPVSGRGMTLADLYPQYYKDVRHLDVIDVYRVHALFRIDDPSGCLQHADKKILLSGARTGGKPKLKDIREARDTLTRYLEMMEEDKARTL